MHEQPDGTSSGAERVEQPAVLLFLLGPPAAVQEAVDADETPAPEIDRPVVGAGEAGPAVDAPSVDGLAEHQCLVLLADVVVAGDDPPRCR